MRRSLRVQPWVILGAAVPVALVGWLVIRTPAAPHVVDPIPVASAAKPTAKPDNDPDNHDDERSYVFRIPSGEPTALGCDEARLIVDQVRAGLAYAPEPISPTAFATSAADWLDPHGLLSLAKDAPTPKAIAKAAPDLLADVEGKRQRGCAAARAPAAVLEQWVSELRDAFDKGRRTADGVDAVAAANDPLPPTGNAKEVATTLGKRVGAFDLAHGEKGRAFGDDARKRFFPPLDKAGWTKVVLASAVRAYVPLVDPHGEWAPFDEESHIYEVDLASRPPSRLWGRALPTAIGVRLSESATAPLLVNDVVLSVAHVSLAGLPLEQIDQLGFAASDAKTPVSAVVLRNGKIVTLALGHAADGGAPASGHAAAEMPSERIPFGEGDILLVAVKDVRDDLGDDLASLIAHEREHGTRKLTGVVLDLRGNGGGSTDGALGALSLFLPGAPLFAMKRRDGTVEVDRAPVPRERDRWNGPVATLVDATTASAAEMIAGALATYRRGPTVGTTTFGKGCAQEYVDDDAHAGVLRLTTLVYALPDGTPVQRVGLVPQIRFPFVPADTTSSQEREAKLLHAAPPWRGPDLRDPSVPLPRPDEVAWPGHGGTVGPCKDTDVCKALRLLSAPKRPSVAKH